jgi:hypothetical protein
MTTGDFANDKALLGLHPNAERASKFLSIWFKEWGVKIKETK